MHAVYQSADLREAKHQRNMCACVCLWCSILTVTVILICVTVGLRYSGSRDVLQYPSTLGDTRLISYSAPLCSGGQMSLTTPGFNGGMYFLDQEPPLSSYNTLILTGNFQIALATYDYDYNFYGYANVYVAWQFHLNQGSTMYITSCLIQNYGGGASFVVIQGSHDYDRWRNGYVSGASYEVPLPFCGNQQTTTYTYSITDEAYYYVVYYATAGSPGVRLGLSINRTEYSLAGVSGMPNCTLGSDGSCSADSVSSTKHVLFQTIPSNKNISQVQSFTLNWVCYPRNNIYVAIFFVPLIILALLFCGCFGIYCVTARLCWSSSRYNELKEDHAHVHAQPVSEKPPPYSAGTI